MRRLNMKTKCVSAALVVIMVVSVIPGVAADSGPSDRVVRFKSGQFTCRVLQPNGARPQSGARVELVPASGEGLKIEGTSNSSGVCSLTVEPGLYVISIDGVRISVAEFGLTAEHSELRMVMPPEHMLVGGQTPLFTFFSQMNPWVLGGIVAAAVAIPLAIDHGDSEPASP